MKYLKFFILPLWLLVNSFGASAQSGYKYFNLAGGYLYKPLNGLTGSISIEFAHKYHSSFDLFAEGYINRYKETETNTERVTRQNYLLGFAFKPLITRSKNTSFRLKLGSGFGSNGSDFIIAPQAGFELSQALNGGFEIMVQQNNSYVFWDTQHWRSGVALGFKIPF